MAKHLLFDYTFDASANQVKLKGNKHQRRTLIITNTTDNIIIYNFADSTKTGTFVYSAATDETTITLQHDCSAMSDTDSLQIFEEEDAVKFEPSETFVDAVSKFRVSNPENLVDTDFEYGPQASKWETIQTINNIPSFYSSTSDTTIPFISKVEAVAGNELITVTTQYDHSLTSGVPITVTGLAEITAEGTYIIQSVPTTTTFTYKARASQPVSRELQGTYTSIIPGKFFQGSQVSLSSAVGIVSDLYNLKVTVKAVTELTLTGAAPTDWLIGQIATGDAGGFSGTISKVDGSVLTVTSTSGTAQDAMTVSVTGSDNTGVVGSSGVNEAAGNKYFIDDIQQDTVNFSRKSIYTFDLSDSSTATHPLRFSTTADGTHGGGSQYTTYVYEHGTAGSAGAYTRIYVTESTSTPLYYYCVNHAGMGGSATSSVFTTSKVYLTTQSEHGFEDNTNFYFVNTVSPKVLELQDPTATAPDGKPFTDITAIENVAVTVDRQNTFPYNYECTWTKRFTQSDVDMGTNIITIPNHGFHNRAAVLYYPNPGNRPIGGLNRMQVYYVSRINDDSFYLQEAMRLNQGNINLVDNYPAASYPHDGTFTFGAHNLGLVYNIRREQKSWYSWQCYEYTYYWDQGGTYSGYDFQTVNGTYGRGQTGWDRVVFFATNRPGYDGSRQYFYINWYYWNRSNSPRTYGYHHDNLPRGTTERFNGRYGFLQRKNSRYINDQNQGDTSYGYTVQGYGSNLTNTFYYRDNMYCEYMNSQHCVIRGNEFYYWVYQEGQSSSVERYYGSYSEDGQANNYIALIKRNNSTNDSFYKIDHGFPQNQQVQLSTSNSGVVRYFYDSYHNDSQYTSGTFYIDRIDSNRFRIKTSTGAEPVNLRYITGNVAFTGQRDNSTKYSFYISNNLFSNNELLKLTTAGSVAGGLSAGNSYYVKVLNGNRFQLASSAGGSAITLSSQGSGVQTFENTTAEFGTVDGSYTTTKAISETELEVSIPFKIPPSIKQFNTSSDVNTTDDHIKINNHYYSTGTRVIYDNAGNTTVPGLTHNVDYYVIVIDNNYFKLAETQALAEAGTQINLTGTGSGIQSFVSANLSGEVTGTGTVEVETGSRRVVGDGAAFQRFFKIGDEIKIVNTTSGTPGVLEERTITAITDDDNMLVNAAWTFTQSGTNYMIPSYIYVRPDGFFLHRPFDGGMEIGTSKSPNSRISRQTRKYFRYQSGKGIQTSLAINFSPQVPIINLTYTASGIVVTKAATMTIGTTTMTIDDTTGLVVGQMVTGTGLAANTRIASVTNGTTLELDLACISALTASSVTFDQKYLASAQCTKPHQLTAGLKVKVIKGDTTAFNVEGPIETVVDDFIFTYLLTTEPTASKCGGFPTLSVISWSGCDIRCGMFDDQNGFFFEYNGSTLNCVRRSSVQQVPGRVSVTKQSHIITGTGTMFTSELDKDDLIVIRGMTYKIVKVTSDTQLTVQPSYRGVSNNDVIITKTVDTKVGQADWNIDTGDGNGKSGYILDITKIQMAYMDYSWYGAGKIRFGFKDQHGHVKYFHQFKHNNLLTESYFRSGNLPARYEIENGDAPNYVGTLFHWGTSVIMDGTFQNDEAYLFTASGNSLKFTNSSAQSSTSNNNSTLTSDRYNWWNRYYYIRIPFASGQAGTLTINQYIYESSVANGWFAQGKQINNKTYTSGSTHYVYIQYSEGTTTLFPRNYSSTINSNLGNPAVPNGTAFSVGAPSGGENLIPTDIPLVSIRLAPSVDSSITGGLGEREIINRMQLALDSVGILTTHETEVNLILNPNLSVDTFQNVDEPSLCQLVRHEQDDTISGGSTILSFRASGSGAGGTNSTNFDLSRISALGNSILGGDGIYPNGPDLLTVVANVVDSTSVDLNNPYQISARITWQESQA